MLFIPSLYKHNVVLFYVSMAFISRVLFLLSSVSTFKRVCRIWSCGYRVYLCRLILSDRSIRRRLTTKICIVVGRVEVSHVNRDMRVTDVVRTGASLWVRISSRRDTGVRDASVFHGSVFTALLNKVRHDGSIGAVPRVHSVPAQWDDLRVPSWYPSQRPGNQSIV